MRGVLFTCMQLQFIKSFFSLSKNDVQHLRVRLGDHNIKSNSAAGRVEKRVKRVIRHIGFSSSTLVIHL